MPTNVWKWVPATFGFLLCVLIASVLAGAGQGQPADPGGKNEPRKEPLKTYYFGKQACFQNCHDLQKPREDKVFPVLCRCTEGTIWEKEDKHGLAWEVLREKNPEGKETRSGQMARLLEMEAKPTEAKECLSCHAVNVQAGATKDPTFDVKEGVSCVICHGPHEEWVPLHFNPLPGKRKAWRDMPRSTKEDMYGMTDLWNPVKRTQLCVSCHVGDGKEKVVTHKMYAAGHPPLPGFEASTFSAEMPRHWQYLREKSPEVQAALKYDGKELEQTKLVLVNSALVLSQTLRMMEADAARCEKGGVLDFALFDCYACHHDLRSPSWRQTQGYVGKPGRVQMRPWASTLISLGVGFSKNVDVEEAERESKKFLDPIYKAFDDQPFGDSSKVRPLAAAAAGWAEGVAKDLAEKRCEKEDIPRLRKLLLQLAEGKKLDYDSARQLAWVSRSVSLEANGNPGPALEAQLKILETELKLGLPSKRDRSILGELDDSLKRIREYEPERIRDPLKALANALDK